MYSIYMRLISNDCSRWNWLLKHSTIACPSMGREYNRKNVFIANALSFMCIFDRYKVLVAMVICTNNEKNYFIMGSNLFNKYNLIWCAIKEGSQYMSVCMGSRKKRNATKWAHEKIKNNLKPHRTYTRKMPMEQHELYINVWNKATNWPQELVTIHFALTHTHTHTNTNSP